MQTFLPYDEFARSAFSLDSKRLGKQRVEAKQILIALGVDVGEHKGNASSRWRHHPAVRMWRGHELWLAHYGWRVCAEWINRGFKDSLMPQFGAVIKTVGASKFPSWVGNEAFHASHRSNLLRKSPEYYSRLGWSEPSDLEYVWPV